MYLQCQRIALGRTSRWAGTQLFLSSVGPLLHLVPHVLDRATGTIAAQQSSLICLRTLYKIHKTAQLFSKSNTAKNAHAGALLGLGLGLVVLYGHRLPLNVTGDGPQNVSTAIFVRSSFRSFCTFRSFRFSPSKVAEGLSQGFSLRSGASNSMLRWALYLEQST